MRTRHFARTQHEALCRGEEVKVVVVGYAMITYIRENPMATFDNFSKVFPDATLEQYDKACKLA